MMRRDRLQADLHRLAALCGALVVAACATAPHRPAPPPPPAAPASVPPPQARQRSGDAKFDAFLAQARTDALAQGITAASFDSATAGIAPIPSIIAMNANQPEFSRPVWSYLDSAVSARRIADGQFMLTRYREVLDRIAAQSGVPKEILVAVWGMESDYGADSGSFNLFAALATLAYDGPRAAYAKPEFLAALQIYQQQHYPLSEMAGSWAGAFGQTQFTPTTFLKYAADGDNDGQVDLWRSPPDALASAARLLADQGWKRDQHWGYEVTLPGNFAYEDADLDSEKPVSEWTARGVKTANGDPLPPSDDGAAIYLPAGARGPAFLVFANFRAILKYNNAASYALAVSLLADRMAGAGPVRHAWPRDERALSRSERIAFQSDLQKLGFDPGTPDGVLGRKSRAALRQYQKSKSLAADGFPTAALLAMLDADAAQKSPQAFTPDSPAGPDFRK
ncbi:MAG TPA: lytic murein transglycosylase [Rhizomicrobium sp.]|nr:lytic murein transglycosylase [Rhizomicrobium sp.]